MNLLRYKSIFRKGFKKFPFFFIGIFLRIKIITKISANIFLNAANTLRRYPSP